MPFTVKISPSVVAGTQAAIVPDVSLKNAGLMTPELLALLLAGGGGGGAVIFDGGGTDKNLRSDRPTNQSPINNAKTGQVNLSSSTIATAGANGDWATISGGDQNEATNDYASVGGGQGNIVDAQFGTIPGGFGNEVHGQFGSAAGHACVASGNAACAMGVSNNATGNGSFAEGDHNNATAQGAHSEGIGSLGAGLASHAQNVSCAAYAEGAHASGYQTQAFGRASTVLGRNCAAIRDGQLTHSSGEANSTTLSTQASQITMCGDTPGAAPGESVELLFGPAPGQFFFLEDDRSYNIQVRAVAVGDIAIIPSTQVFNQTFVARQVAGTVVLVASGALEQLGDAGSASWTLVATAAVAPNRFALTFSTGATTSPVKITASVNFVEIQNT